jgi:hypothetical protein
VRVAVRVREGAGWIDLQSALVSRFAKNHQGSRHALHRHGQQRQPDDKETETSTHEAILED